MRTLPIKQGYINSPVNDIILFYSGQYKVIDNYYHLFFIANKEGVVYDTLLAPADAVLFDTDNKLIITSNEDEVFIKINS